MPKVPGHDPVIRAYDPIRNIVFINKEAFDHLPEEQMRALISHVEQMPQVQ